MIKGGYQLIDFTKYDIKYETPFEQNIKGTYEKVTCGKPVIVKLNVRADLNTNTNSTIICNMSIQKYENRCVLRCVVGNQGHQDSILMVSVDHNDTVNISISSINEA